MPAMDKRPTEVYGIVRSAVGRRPYGVPVPEGAPHVRRCVQVGSMSAQ